MVLRSDRPAMRWLPVFALLACSTLALRAGPTKPPIKAKASAKTSSHTVAAKPSSKTTAHLGVKGSAVSAKRQTASVQKVSSRSATRRRGRASRVSYAPPPPSYQLHPDADRYLEIQKALADRGYFKGEVNGEWGDDSVDALKRFQIDQKLLDDGKINSLSLIGLGLGPKHDGSSTPGVASPVAVIAPPASVPIGGSPPATALAPAAGPGASTSGLPSHLP
jgi:hypothetical protein